MTERVIAEHRGTNPPAAWRSLGLGIAAGPDAMVIEIVIRRAGPGHWQLVQRSGRVWTDDEGVEWLVDRETGEIWPRGE